MSKDEFIDPNCVVGVAKVDQDMARIREAVCAQEPEMVHKAVKEMVRLEQCCFNSLLALSTRVKGTNATDKELNHAMDGLPKVKMPTAEGWLISMLAIYGWNRLAEDVCNARKADAGISAD